MNYFSNSEVFSSLSEADQWYLSAFCQERDLLTWEFLFRENDKAEAMYLIRVGSCRILKSEEEVAIVGVWDIVWEMAFLDPDKKRNASVQARENVNVVTIIRFAFDQIADKNPELFAKFAKIIEGRR